MADMVKDNNNKSLIKSLAFNNFNIKCLILFEFKKTDISGLYKQVFLAW